VLSVPVPQQALLGNSTSKPERQTGSWGCKGDFSKGMADKMVRSLGSPKPMHWDTMRKLQ
jgi:hypothetical protein